MADNLTNKTILITGAGSGIGKATAMACAEAGMNVALAARRRDALEQVASEIRQLGREALVLPCDVQSDDQVRHLFDQVQNAWQTLDVVFANAGYGLFETITRTTEAQMRDIFETNFFGTVRCLQQAVPIMQQQNHGHLLVCASACSEISLPYYGFYAATKAAQDSICGALRAELSHTSLHVTTIHPIGTRTEFFNVVAQHARRSHVGLNTPDMMMQSPRKVARAIVRCLKHPCPEVWPSPLTRWAVALTTAMPRLSTLILKRVAKRMTRQAASTTPHQLQR